MDNIATPFRIVALISVLIGLSLFIQFNDVKSTITDTMDTIFEPINNFDLSPNSTFNFDPDTYLAESTDKTINMAKTWIKFERNLVIGVSAILFGISLFICSCTSIESEFWNRVGKFDFFS